MRGRRGARRSGSRRVRRVLLYSERHFVLAAGCTALQLNQLGDHVDVLRIALIGAGIGRTDVGQGEPSIQSSPRNLVLATCSYDGQSLRPHGFHRFRQCGFVPFAHMPLPPCKRRRCCSGCPQNTTLSIPSFIGIF